MVRHRFVYHYLIFLNQLSAILTSIFSAGNAFVYCSSRSLYGLAQDGHAPPIFRWKNRNGVPVVAVGLVLLLGTLAFMQVDHGANVVLNWFATIPPTYSEVLTRLSDH